MVSVSLSNAIPTSHLYDEYRNSQYRQYEAERLRELLVDTVVGTLSFLSYFLFLTSILFCKATAPACTWRRHERGRQILPQHRFLVLPARFAFVQMILILVCRQHRFGELYAECRPAEYRLTSGLTRHAHCACACHTQQWQRR